MSICPIIDPFFNFNKFNNIKKTLPYLKKTFIFVGCSIMIKKKQKIYHRLCGTTYGYSKNAKISFSDSNC